MYKDLEVPAKFAILYQNNLIIGGLNHDLFFKILQYVLNVIITTRGNMKKDYAFLGINGFHNRYTIISLKNKSQIGNLTAINTVVSLGGFQAFGIS